MKQLIYPIVLVITALGVGFGLSYYSLEQGRELTATHYGVWSGWPELGTAQIDPYARAHLARQGMLPLGKGEGVRFFAQKDTNGDALSGRCEYSVRGHMPNHALWTIQVRDPGTNQVFGHAESGQMQFSSDGAFDLAIAPKVKPGNWVNTDGLGRIELLLTLYDTNAFTNLGSEEIELPQVQLEAC
ncbi:hypothetical protein MXMO3_02637 [Maritalea myrionectae]|uniref:DUF1214 domain-containing protein n=1 Tax=Maritalea myrionectae TaxID=454601 RepID=A0A2R4MGZ0_9HYPH|nr:DUF1214 domain-containing protein [Maritalea myrionectae]AVX05149.1 hypothetical protein MXMO3_02637 [Maritalea myrionectae]